LKAGRHAGPGFLNMRQFDQSHPLAGFFGMVDDLTSEYLGGGDGRQIAVIAEKP